MSNIVLWSSRDDYLNEINSNFPYYLIKKHNVINYFLNLFAVETCIFFKLNLIEIAFVFVAFDIFCCGLDYIIVRVLPDRYEKEKDPNKIKKRLERNIKKKLKFEKKVAKIYESTPVNYDKGYTYSGYVDWLERLIKKDKKFISSLEKEVAPKVKAYDVVRENNLDEINRTLQQLYALKNSKFIDTYNINLLDVTLKIKAIVKILKVKPNGLPLATKSINLYGNELITIITEISNKEKSKQKEYINKINLIISEYSDHLDRVLERIKDSNDVQTNINIDVFLKEIRKDKEG